MAHEAWYNTITTKQFIATKQKTFGDKNFLIEQCFHVIVFVSTVQAPNRQVCPKNLPYVLQIILN